MQIILLCFGVYEFVKWGNTREPILVFCPLKGCRQINYKVANSLIIVNENLYDLIKINE